MAIEAQATFGQNVVTTGETDLLDRFTRRMIDPPLAIVARRVVSAGISADRVTLTGLGMGLAGAAAITFGYFELAMVLILASRFLDGLDGAVAREGKITDFGGYLDIVCDFAFYGAVPLAFVIYDPAQNGVAGAFLLTSFYVNGATFLAYSALAAKRGMATTASGIKSIYYSNGLLEGTETIAFFVVLCVWPETFSLLAYVFGALCFATATLRSVGLRSLLKKDKTT